MDIADRILNEANIDVEKLFNGHDSGRYSFIARDRSKFDTPLKKKEIIKRLEKYRLVSGDGIKNAFLDPKLFVATQDTVDTDKIKGVAENAGDIKSLPLIVKLNNVYYAIDGHHRSSVALITNKPKIEVHLIDLDR